MILYGGCTSDYCGIQARRDVSTYLLVDGSQVLGRLFAHLGVELGSHFQDGGLAGALQERYVLEFLRSVEESINIY